MTQPWLWAPVRPGTPLVQVIGAGAIDSAPLPDDPPPSAGPLNWAPGALEGVLGHHTAPSTATDDATEQVVAVLDAYRRGQLDRVALQRMYDLLAAGSVDVGNRTARRVGEYARAQSDSARLQEVVPAIRDIASWLIDTGVNRTVVTTGLALAALLNDCANRREAVAILGRHATFAGAAITALSRADATDDIFALAQQHTGWGRIQAVEALVPTQRPDIRRWILTGGFRNDVLWGYLADIVARYCDLARFLAEVRDDRIRSARSAAVVDDVAALDGARDLLSTLLEPYGPSGDISDYPNAGAATGLWLELTELRTDAGPTITDLAFAVDLAAALSNDDRLDDENGFGPTQREAFTAACQRLLTAPRTRAVVEAAMSSGQSGGMSSATRVAAVLGVDPFPPFLPQLRRDPDDTGLWYHATQAVGPHVAELVAAAQELLPANGVATNSRACIGPLPGPHMGVTFVLQQVVGRAPGVGWPWLAQLLRSPQSGIRWQALTALEAWPRDRWPADAADVLRAARAAEDDPKLQERLSAALQ